MNGAVSTDQHGSGQVAHAQAGRQLCPVRRFLQLGRFGLLLFGALDITPGARAAAWVITRASELSASLRSWRCGPWASLG